MKVLTNVCVCVFVLAAEQVATCASFLLPQRCGHYFLEVALDWDAGTVLH